MTPMPCGECRPLLLDHAYDALPPAEAAAVAAHLDTCPACRAAVADVRRVQGLIAAAAKAPFPGVVFAPPADVRPAAAPARRPASRWIGWAVAASLLAAVGGLGVPALLDATRYAKHRMDVDGRMAEVAAADATRAGLRADLTGKVKAAADRKAAAERAHNDVGDRWIAAEVALKTKEARTYEVEIVGPRTAIPGAPNEYRLNVTDTQKRPYAATMDAVVKTSGGAELFAQRFEADKNPDGNVLRLPAGAWANVKAGEDVLLHIMAVDPKTGTKSELTENLKLLEPVYATFLTTDKPMYRPGEVVFFRSLTLDRTRFLPPQKETTLRFEIKAPSGQVLPGSQQMGLAKPVAVSKDGRMHSVIGPDGQPVRGVGTGAFPLGDDLAGGEYTLNVWEVPQPGEAAKSSHNKPLAVRKFVVNKYTPDRMVKTLEFDGKSYGPGDVVQAKLTLKDQSKPLANAVLSVTADADGQPLKLDVAPAKTDADGVASIKLTLPKSDDLKEVRLNVTATANRITESIPRRVPLAARTLDVEFFPEGGDLVAGVPNRVYFRARTGNGQPADLTGTLTDGLADLAGVQTLKDADRPGANQGMGSFTFTPVTGKRYAVRLSTPASVRPPVIGALGNDHAAAIGSQAALAYRGYPLPDAKAAGVVLHAPAGLVKAGDPIRVRLTSHAPRTVFVGAYTRGRPVGSAKVAIPGPAGVEVALESTDAKLGGVTRVTVFDLPTEDTLGKDELKPLAERLVYRRPTEELKIAYEARKAGAAPGGAFVPGSKLMLDITAKDETDAPKPAILWAAIVNKSVLAMADEKTERMQPTHFLLNGEVQKGEDLEFADFLLTDHPTAAAALDLLLGTQGWRRFAEQRQEYRQKKLSPEEAEQLLLASATTGPIPTGWQNDLRKVFDTYWPKYESTQIDLEEAETAKARVDNDLSPLPAISRADAEYVAKLRAFREPAADLTADAAALDRRRGTLPYLLTGLLALAAAGFAIRYLAFAPGAPARAPLGIGAVGFVLLAGFLAVTTYATGRNNDGWRAVAKAAEMPSPTEAPQDPAETTRADRLRNSPPVIEALDNLNDGKGLKLAEEKAAGRPEPKADALAPAGAPPDVAAMALPAPAPPGAVPPPVAAPALKLAPQAAPAMGGVRPMMMRAGPKPADDDKAKEQREFGGDDRKDRMAKKRPANGPVPGGARFDNFMQKREQQFGLADATDARGMGQMASVPAHFRQFMPHAEPFPVREYAHVWAAPANGSDAREDFAETLLWQPVLVTPKDGRLTVEFALSDAIQPYRVLIAGHTTDGRLGAVTGVIEVRKPFSLDVKLPQEIGSGDVLQVPVLGTNATDADVAAALKVTPTGFTLGSPDGPTLDLPSAGGSRLLLRAAPAKTEGTLAIEVAGKAGSNTDSVKRTVTVVPDGFPVQGSASDVLEKSFRTSMKLPEMLVPGSLKLRVTMYPNTLSEVQNGLEGCCGNPTAASSRAAPPTTPTCWCSTT